MSRLRIKGLVRVADSVRRELAQPLSPSRRDQLRETVVRSLREVDRISAKHGTTIEGLPEPTRRAYRFLSSLNFDSITPQATSEVHTAPRGNVSLVGLKSFWEGVLVWLAKPITAEKADELYHSIRSTSENIEAYLQADDLTAKDLTAQSRSIRGWLAYYSERENFDAYLAAVARARPILETSIKGTGRLVAPAIVEFRPMTGLYGFRGYRDSTRVILPTPTIYLSEEQFTVLARAAFNGGPKQPLVEVTLTEQYQSVQAELEVLSGVEEQTAGVHRNLEESFQRVVVPYFGGALLRPRVTWSKAFTGRKFGHYDPIRDTVMISCTLDRADAPEFVLDSVMHHKLLHKKLGVGWCNGRMKAHPPAFRVEERRFARYREAEAILRPLAGET